MEVQRGCGPCVGRGHGAHPGARSLRSLAGGTASVFRVLFPPWQELTSFKPLLALTATDEKIFDFIPEQNMPVTRDPARCRGKHGKKHVCAHAQGSPGRARKRLGLQPEHVRCALVSSVVPHFFYSSLFLQTPARPHTWSRSKNIENSPVSRPLFLC